MADKTSDREQSRLTLSRPGRLELKKSVETGKVRQSFSHGRSKTVTVEVKKKRSPAGAGGRKGGPQGGLSEQERAARARALKALQERAATAPPPAPELEAAPEPELAAPEPEVAREPELTPEERELMALREAEAEETRKVQEETARREAEQARLEAEQEAKRQDEQPRRGRADRPERAGRGETGVRRPAAEQPAEPAAEPAARPRRGTENEDRAPRREKRETKKPGGARRNVGDSRRRSGKLTITQALDENVIEQRQRSLASVRRAREREKQRRTDSREVPAKVLREVILPETITVQELANRMAERASDVVRSLMKMGVMAAGPQTIDADTAELVVEEFGHRVRRVSEADVELGIEGQEDEERDLQPRPPVVTVMGHVDHGKTSLLDALRSTDVAAGEAGGITQHIGAYQVTLASGDRITFLDTPGHEAFSAMRQRGAQATDIVVLVVAADDGVQPQTVEAINHAKAAGVPMIVAINKIDRPDATADRVKNELLQYEIVVEEMGGDVQAVPVSAIQRTNLDKLEEAILLQAEVLELTANPEREAQGVVVEAQLDRGRGSVATILVQRGTLRVGDTIVAGNEWGRVRALIDDRGNQVESAGPSVPVEVLGLQGTPQAGDQVAVVENETRAREISDFRQRRERDKRTAVHARGTIEQMFQQIAAGESKELPVVIKSDVQGSTEAIVAALEKLGTEEVQAKVLHAGVGGINESDVTLAAASNAFIIGFNVRANKQARDLAQRDGIDIRYYSIIYELLDDMKAAMSGLLAPLVRENLIGNAEIREVFSITKAGKIAGCRITDGIVRRGAGVRLLRDNVVVHQGKLATLKRFKDDVREVREGFECGMSFENYQDIQVGDVIECYETEEVARQL